jgi:CheY-like chemotaxis protein
LEKAANATDTPPDTGEATLTPQQNRHILLVEDHEQTRVTLTQLLQRRGHVVVAVATSEAARARAAAGNCDLLVSDLGLPDGDGYELMAELHRTQGMPGIALSGYGMDADVARSRACGFYAHLTKPVDIRVLEAAIASAPFPATVSFP